MIRVGAAVAYSHVRRRKLSRRRLGCRLSPVCIPQRAMNCLVILLNYVQHGPFFLGCLELLFEFVKFLFGC